MIYELLVQSNLIQVLFYSRKVEKTFSNFRLDLYLLKSLNIKCHSLSLNS